MLCILQEETHVHIPMGEWSTYRLIVRHIHSVTRIHFYPKFKSTPCQTNGYDCGVWVLATMAAIFRGFEVTGITELSISRFRRYVLELVLRLPSCN